MKTWMLLVLFAAGCVPRPAGPEWLRALAQVECARRLRDPARDEPAQARLDAAHRNAACMEVRR